MSKTFSISFSLKNTYRVNGILFSIKQIPIVKNLLPDTLYGIKGFKVFANIISAIWEIGSTFLGKFLYFLFMVVWMAGRYKSLETVETAMHIMLFLSIIGAFANTYMFDPSKDKYYAIVLMRMNAKEYTLVNYFYAIAKVVAGFLPATLILGLTSGVPLWLCLLIPFFVAGIKIAVASLYLRYYEKNGRVVNENVLGKAVWVVIGGLLACAYGLPALNIVVPLSVSVGAMALSILCGLVALRKILFFEDYGDMYKQVLSKAMNQIDDARNMPRTMSQNAISDDARITSNRKGLAYLNEIFIKRHQKILWKASKKIAYISLLVIIGLLVAFHIVPESKDMINEMMLTFLPWFVFVMYMINRGTGFTQALFMNCDHSLLTYSFYKQPASILKLFQIRLWEIIKINLLPAIVIGVGMAVLLYASGGTDNPLNYAVIVVSIICLSMFFSLHYLTIYYLLQPYNAATEIKSATYKIVLSVTYFACFVMMQMELPTMLFGLACIAFFVLYCIVASTLIYRFAPKTFKLRV